MLQICTNDIDAWEQFPKSRWMFNKLQVLQGLGHECAPLGICPQSFPVRVKPISNLLGMGIGSYLAQTQDDVNYQPGMFWMRNYTGIHRSYDINIKTGQVYVAIGSDGPYFTKWIVRNATVEETEVANYYTMCLKQQGPLPDHINIETIGWWGFIECHPRWSAEWTPHYNSVPFVQHVCWDRYIETGPPADWVDCRCDESNMYSRKKRIGYKIEPVNREMSGDHCKIVVTPTGCDVL
jgi:hypothetical protein